MAHFTFRLSVACQTAQESISFAHLGQSQVIPQACSQESKWEVLYPENQISCYFCSESCLVKKMFVIVLQPWLLIDNVICYNQFRFVAFVFGCSYSLLLFIFISGMSLHRSSTSCLHPFHPLVVNKINISGSSSSMYQPGQLQCNAMAALQELFGQNNLLSVYCSFSALAHLLAT